MGILQFLKRKQRETQNARVTSPVILTVGREMALSVVACINALLSTLLLATYRAQRSDGTPHAEAQQLLDFPDGQLPFSEWVARLLWETFTDGNGYAVLLKEEQQPILVHVPAENVVVYTDDWGRIVGYEARLGREKRVFIEREVVHVPFWLPSDTPGVGSSPLQLLQKLVEADDAIWRYIISVLRNFGAPSVLYTYEGQVPLPPSELAVVSEVLREGYRKDRIGNVAVVGFPLRAQPLGGLPEGGFENFLYSVEAAVSSVYRVPAQVAGLSIGYRFSTYSNYENALENFVTNTILPLHQRLSWQLYKVLFSLYPDLGDVVVDTTQYSVLGKARWQQAAALGQLFQLGVLSTDEVRTSLGFEPLERESARDTMQREEEKSDVQYWKEWDALWQRAQVRLLKEIRAVLREYRDMLANFLTGGGKALGAEDIEFKAGFTLSALLEEFVETLRARTREVMQRYAEEAARKSIAAVRRWVRRPVEHVIEQALTSGAEEAVLKVELGGKTIAREVGQLVWQLWGQASVDFVAAELRLRFQELETARARTIARTATTAAITRTQKVTWDIVAREHNIRFKRFWISMRDERVRDSHREMDGKPEDDDGLFTLPSGLRGEGPGLFDDPSESVNCRCTTRPRRVT